MTANVHKRDDALWCILHDATKESRVLSPSTKYTYLNQLDIIVAALGCNPYLWTKESVKQFYTDLCKRIKIRSANEIIRTLNSTIDRFNNLESGAPLPYNLTKFELFYPESLAQRDSLSEQEIHDLLWTCGNAEPADIRDFAVLVTALETGMRRLSLVNLSWDRLRVQDGITIATVRAKGKEKLEVPLSPTALRGLENWKVWGHRKGIQQGIVFRSLVRGIGEGEMSEQSIYNIIQKRAKMANLSRHIHPHLTRHTFVMLRVKNEVDLNVIASVTGHELVGISKGLQYYISRSGFWKQAVKTTPDWLSTLVDAIAEKQKQMIR